MPRLQTGSEKPMSSDFGNPREIFCNEETGSSGVERVLIEDKLDNLANSIRTESRVVQENPVKFLRPQVLTERVILILICTAVILGFGTPIVIYVVNINRSGNSTTITIGFDVDKCQSSATTTAWTLETFSQSGDGIFTPSLYDETCTSYSGQCAEYLEIYDTTSLFTLTLKKISENDIGQFMATLNQFMGTHFISKQCAEVVFSFLCQYIHPPCDGNGSVNLISQEQCRNIRDVVCDNEWRLVMATSSSSLLPVCEHFSNVDNITDDNTTLIISQPLQCHYQFKEYCGLCLPLCGEFSQYRANTELGERSVIVFSSIVAFIGGVLVFIAAIWRQKALLDFPSVLVLYKTLCAFVIVCFVLITYIGGQKRLYCTHEALSVSFGEPSAFCQVSGFMFHWLLVLLSVLWLLHVIHLFIKIVFPVKSRQLDFKRTKIILHVIEVVGAAFITILAPVIFVSVSEYNIGRFPPVLCFPSREVGFYTMCVPLCVTVGAGVVLTIVMFWILHQKQQLFKKQSSKWFCYIKFSVPEVKVLIISCYFIIFGITALVNVSITVRDGDIAMFKLLVYFTCQAAGYNGTDTCAGERDDLESHLKPELNAATYFLLGLVPWLNLLFAIQVQDIKRALHRILAILHQNAQQKTSTVKVDDVSGTQL